MGSGSSRRVNRLSLTSTVEIVNKEYSMNHKGVKCVKSKVNGQKWEIYYINLNSSKELN